MTEAILSESASTSEPCVEKRNNYMLGLSSLELKRLDEHSIEERRKTKFSPAYNRFLQFKSNELSMFVKPPKSKENNVTDVAAGVSYLLPATAVKDFMTHVEECRRNGDSLMISERQVFPNSDHSGMMIDLDLRFKNKLDIAVSDCHYRKMAMRAVHHLRQVVDFEDETEVTTCLFFTVRPKVDIDPGTNTFKFGLHLIIPGIKLTQGTKKFILSELRKDQAFLKVIADIGHTGGPENAVDRNSASVPVFFHGSCKPTGLVYNIGKALRVTFTTLRSSETMMDFNELSGAVLEDYNLAYEMSVNFEANYPGKEPLVRKRSYNCRQTLACQIQDLANKTYNNINDPEDLLEVQNRLHDLIMANPEAKQLYKLLDILSEEFYTDRNRWRDVIFAIVNTSETFKPIAVWFSQKCPEKWTSNGEETLDTIWDEAVFNRNRSRNNITLRSIHHWAKSSNPSLYEQINSYSSFSILHREVYSTDGRINHYSLGLLMKTIFRNKYVVDIDCSPKNERPVWYEFVYPNDQMKDGEVWKWRQEHEPETMMKYISEIVPTIYMNVIDHIDGKMKQLEMTEDVAMKRYARILRNLLISKNNLGVRPYKKNVITEAQALFRKRGFIDGLDKDGSLLGVGNGILKLSAECRLINHFHEYSVSKFTPTRFRRFNPLDPNPFEMKLLRAIEKIIPEPDARMKILYLMSTSLSGDMKDPVMLIWEGGGQNGKTFLVLLLAKTLGKAYSAKLPMTLLTLDRESSEKPNSAFMSLKGKRLGYFEESNKHEKINTARLKEMVNSGEGTGSEKFEKQESFNMTATLISMTQFSYTINTTDHGTWRRLWRYVSKVRFVANPNPENPFEQKEDVRFAKEYVSDADYQEAFLGILTYFYERLQNEYQGEVKSIPSQTIDRETEVYRNQQDLVNRFVTSLIVKTNSAAGPGLNLNSVAEEYGNWLQDQKEETGRVPRSELRKQIENSVLQKFITRNEKNEPILNGCRILGSKTDNLMPGEEYIGFRSAPPDPRLMVKKEESWWLAPKKNVATEGPSREHIPYLDDRKYREPGMEPGSCAGASALDAGAPALDAEESFDDLSDIDDVDIDMDTDDDDDDIDWSGFL